MSFLDKFKQSVPVVSYADPKPEEDVVEKEVAPYGETALGLTRFGDVWIDMSPGMIQGIVFNPPDEDCAAQVFMTNRTSFHLSDSDAAALELFLHANIAPKI